MSIAAPEVPEVEAYARAVAERLGDHAMAVYLQGSAALSGYTPGPSDIDMIAVSPRALSPGEKQGIVDVLRHEALPCPASGLELVLYSEHAVKVPARSPVFELNLNTGPRRPFHVAFGPGVDHPHWFVLDLAVTRAHGLCIKGPLPHELIAPIPRLWLLEALGESLAWHDAFDAASPNRVLNACRAWRYVVEEIWCTKAQGAAWARARTAHAEIIDRALAHRAESRFTDLDPASARALIQDVRAALEMAAARESSERISK